MYRHIDTHRRPLERTVSGGLFNAEGVHRRENPLLEGYSPLYS